MNNNKTDEAFIDRTIYILERLTSEWRKISSKIDLINEYDSMIESEETSSLTNLINKGVIDAKAVNGTVGKPIHLEINSNGGETSAGYSIITAIENSDTPIIGYVTGNCMSMAIAILASCHYRMASEYSEFMIHDVYSGMQGKYSDLNSTIEYIKRVRNNYNKVLVKYTKLGEDEVNELVSKNSDHYFSPFDAKDMGIIDNLDIDTIDEEEFFNRLYGNGGDEEEDSDKIEETVEKITEDDSELEDSPEESTSELTNLEKLEEHIGYKLD